MKGERIMTHSCSRVLHGKHEKEFGGPGGVKTTTADKDIGPQSYNHKKLNMASNLNECKSRFIFRVSRQKFNPANSRNSTL